MKEENKKMKLFLAENGISCRVKYIDSGSLKGTWRVYNSTQKWNQDLINKLHSIGFNDFEGNLFSLQSGNGGVFSVFATGHNELK